MAQENRDLAAFASIAVAGALTFLALGRPPAASASPLDAVPEASFMVISVDVGTLRGSPIFKSVFGKDRMEALQRACGFDPLTRIEELDVAVPEGGDTGDFGIAANGAMQKAELVACAEKLLGARGAHATVTSVGSFTRVDGDASGPRLAFREGGPFLVGRGAWLDTMMQTAEARGPSIRASTVHAALRSSLDSHGSSAKRVVLASAILPRDLRDRLKKEMGADSASESASIMAGVLGVSAAGLAIRVTGSVTDPILEAELKLQCDAPQACTEVERLLAKKRLAWSKDIGMRLVGLGPLIDELKVEAAGSSLVASTRARVDDVTAAIERVMKMTGRSPPTGHAPPPPPAAGVFGADPAIPANPTGFPAPPGQVPPDEVVKPRGAPIRDAAAGPSISEGGR